MPRTASVTLSHNDDRAEIAKMEEQKENNPTINMLSPNKSKKMM